MRDGITTVIRFISTFAGSGAEMAKKSIDGVHKAALIGAKGLASLGSAIGDAGGKFGRMAREAANMMWSIQQLGALGGIMAGAQILIDRLSEHFIAKADAMSEAAERMKDRINDRLDRLNAARLNEVDEALKSATTDAERAAAAFDAMATAYMKVANAGNGKLSAFESAEIADMELRKATEMKNASPDDEPIVGAKADIAIATKRLELTVSATERRIGIAGREEADARKRLAMAKDKEKAASTALAKASEKLQESENSDNKDIETLRQRKEKAEETYAAAVNARVLAEADAKAATENELKVRYESAQAIASAKRSVVEAETMLASLERAKAKKEDEELRRFKVESIKDRLNLVKKVATAVEQQRDWASGRVEETKNILKNAADMDQAGDIESENQAKHVEERYAKRREALQKRLDRVGGDASKLGRLSNIDKAVLDRMGAEKQKDSATEELKELNKKFDKLTQKLEDVTQL